jgi:hypothetical protein
MAHPAVAQVGLAFAVSSAALMLAKESPALG